MGAAYVEWYGKARHQDWRTPRALFDVLDAEFHFDLDGASSNGNSLCAEGSTAEHPIPWDGRRVFCNPPWSDIAPFVEYATRADVAVLLVPARTNTRWFHRALELGGVPRFFLSRPKFEREGYATDNSPVDCLFLVFERSTHRHAVSAPGHGVTVEDEHQAWQESDEACLFCGKRSRNNSAP